MFFPIQNSLQVMFETVLIHIIFFESQYIKYDDYLLSLETLVDLLFAFPCRWISWDIPPLVLFLPFVGYQYWLIILNLYQLNSHMFVMLILVLIKSEQDQLRITCNNILVTKVFKYFYQIFFEMLFMVFITF